ncbi:MAG: Uncharacterized protein FD166_1472 [Bacteroidetes bacterium]|nr:MAG: Uncharacterized protein FD166_1472 [Bacteroidota bacterium]
MTVVAIQNLPALMLSGNFPDEVTFQGSSAPVSIFMNGELLLEETYEHDGNYTIHLKLRDLFNSLLETVIPIAGDVFIQEASVADFGIQVEEQGGPVTYTFRLVKGGIDSEDIIDSTTFLWGNFLTWKPQVKKVKYLDPQWLTYYSVQEARLMIQATYQEADELVTSDPVLLYTLPVYKKCTMNVKFERLWAGFAQEGRAPYFIDCWIADEGNDKKTYTQRYVLSDEYHEFDDIFVFENSLGGVDVIRFTGELEHQLGHEFKSAVFGEETREYDIIFNRSFSKNTGYFKNGYELMWTSDFMASLNRHLYVSGLPVRIVVKSFEAKDIKTELSHYNFTYSFARQSKYLSSSSAAGQLPGMMAEFSGMPSVWDDIYVRIFGDQVVDGVKTFLQPVKANEVKPATGDDLILNELTVKDGGIIDCGEF